MPGSVNAANEIANISQNGWVTPAHDAAGNMVSGPSASFLVFRRDITFDGRSTMNIGQNDR